MLASAVLQRVQDILQDTTGVRWPEAELIRYLNDAQREVVLHKPDASAETRVVTLAVGTRQTVPVDTLRLLEVVRNMGADGQTPGPAVTLIGRAVLDSQRRNWHAETPRSTIDHYVFDMREPKTFYVYPPSDGTVHAEAMLSVIPADVTTVDSVLPLPELYANALIDYVLYRAYSKDADFAANLERSMVHFQSFATALGINLVSGARFSPRANLRDTRDSNHQPPMG
jgi:hypothetical protein